MTPLDNYPFKLDNFEGSLELLIYLIQESELDPKSVLVQDVLKQCVDLLSKDDISKQKIDIGAECILHSSTLLYLKSLSLLPMPTKEKLEEEDPRFEMIQHLLEYCRFKELAKHLSVKEAEQETLFSRTSPFVLDTEAPSPTESINHLSLNDLAKLFGEVLKKATLDQKRTITDDQWKVVDLMQHIRTLFHSHDLIPFKQLFTPEVTAACTSKLGLIITFLALLELMKLEHLFVSFDEKLQEWAIQPSVKSVENQPSLKSP